MMIKDLNFTSRIKKNDLLQALKGEANQLHINDFIKTCSFLKKSMEHVHPHFQEEYIKMYTEGYLKGYRDVKNDKRSYQGYVDVKKLKETIQLLGKQEKLMEAEFGNQRSFKPYLILSLYTTFIQEEPVHPVGTPFPGGLEVRESKGIYYCPVKENNKNNPLAVCGFCIAEQEPDM
ncbi:DUF2115 domain-containing protein [Methanobacterium ferruginis]|uniref:DUF2115 domain-containing protein n=1 Tax=Methanobacterium ferruginis TaxID=710191 RepID=UPI002573529B|nr:DUF2115 domain-containing protein [Methanobacterium ferruginis]BDZ68350.1 hypothetical protein GCM10025860_17980 [Methanobacterium ferruginis]